MTGLKAGFADSAGLADGACGAVDGFGVDWGGGNGVVEQALIREATMTAVAGKLKRLNNIEGKVKCGY